jgi:fatty acid desaturase
VSNPSGSRVITIIVGVIALIGVSSSISPWLDALYSKIAIWVVVALVVALVIYGAVQFPDVATRREVRESWEQNKGVARELAEKHAAHPEVARKLAEKQRRQRLHPAGPVPPPATRG